MDILGCTRGPKAGLRDLSALREGTCLIGRKKLDKIYMCAIFGLKRRGLDGWKAELKADLIKIEWFMLGLYFGAKNGNIRRF
jgi:hypothetical protein